MIINTRNLVVDACIAKSASENDNPFSTRSRDFFMKLIDSDHSIIMTKPIKEEWDNHASKFSRKVLTSLVSKGKVKFIKYVSVVPDIRRAISGCRDAARVEPMKKDLHLIEAAFAGDQIIISSDDKAKNHFTFVSGDSEMLQLIFWINPTKPEEEFTLWLCEGQHLEKKYRLGYKEEISESNDEIHKENEKWQKGGRQTAEK